MQRPAKVVMASASHGSTPKPVKRTGSMPPKAKTEPTERSNSPEIMSTVTPSARNPISGMMPNMTRQFPELMKTGALAKKMAPRMIITPSAASSGRDKNAFVSAFM